jgi:hypothetical protein
VDRAVKGSSTGGNYDVGSSARASGCQSVRGDSDRRGTEEGKGRTWEMRTLSAIPQYEEG